MASGTIKKTIHIVDSNEIKITANSQANAIGTVSFNVPGNAKIISYTIITNNVSGSWNFQLTYFSAQKQVSFYNYGTQSNTWTGYVRVAYML